MNELQEIFKEKERIWKEKQKRPIHRFVLKPIAYSRFKLVRKAGEELFRLKYTKVNRIIPGFIRNLLHDLEYEYVVKGVADAITPSILQMVREETLKTILETPEDESV